MQRSHRHAFLPSFVFLFDLRGRCFFEMEPMVVGSVLSSAREHRFGVMLVTPLVSFFVIVVLVVRIGCASWRVFARVRSRQCKS